MVEKFKRPKLPPPIQVGGDGKIVVKVSGRLQQRSTDEKVIIERID